MRGAFCEYRKLEREARKGQQVEFDVVQGDKGLQAANVQAI